MLQQYQGDAYSMVNVFLDHTLLDLYSKSLVGKNIRHHIDRYRKYLASLRINHIGRRDIEFVFHLYNNDQLGIYAVQTEFYLSNVRHQLCSNRVLQF